MVRTLIITCVMLLPSAAFAGNCQHFFQYKAAVVVPVAVPIIYHSASPGLVYEAQIRKAVREEIRAELSATQKAPQQQRATNTSAFAKCIACHSGTNPKGGVVLDGETAINCDIYFRWGEIAGLGKNVPPAMKQIVDKMTPEEKGAINTELLRLGAADRSQRVEVPPPEQTGRLE